MMSKGELQKWPWNNQPSKRHVWKHVSMDKDGWQTEKCARCGRTFVARADTRGPVYCYATPQWLLDNPNDDGAEG